VIRSPLWVDGDFRDAGLVEKLDVRGEAKRIPVADNAGDFYKCLIIEGLPLECPLDAPAPAATKSGWLPPNL
jgi:hypothetical protein